MHLLGGSTLFDCIHVLQSLSGTTKIYAPSKCRLQRQNLDVTASHSVPYSRQYLYYSCNVRGEGVFEDDISSLHGADINLAT